VHVIIYQFQPGAPWTAHPKVYLDREAAVQGMSSLLMYRGVVREIVAEKPKPQPDNPFEGD